MNRRVTRRSALAAATASLVAPAAARQPAQPRAEAYTDQLSYAPGDEVKLHVSADAADLKLSVMRLGPKTEIVAADAPVKGRLHPVPNDASSHGCRWPVAAAFKVGADWRSGYYVARLDAGNQPAGRAFFVVRPKQPGRESKILIQLSTNTYNAYTNWGGYSLYAYNGRHKVQGRRVSFDRPQSSQFAIWEEPFVRWAEASGYHLDYAVNSDLEFRPEMLKGYKLVLSVGHDEYWSAPMRDHLEKYIGDGGNVAFFSGNTCCWQVRSEDNGRALACCKQSFGDDPVYKSGDHKTLSTAWSHYLVKRPENALTGVGFPVGRVPPQSRAAHGRPRHVHRPPPGPLAVRGHRPEARGHVRGEAAGVQGGGVRVRRVRTRVEGRAAFPDAPRRYSDQLRGAGHLAGEVAPGRLRVVREVGEGPDRETP